MHCLSSGVFQSTLAPLVWELLKGNAWRLEGPNSSVVELGIARFRADLWARYLKEQQLGKQHARIQQLLPS
eukprot:5167639-Alexandrium_andersonii.AAC.1